MKYLIIQLCDTSVSFCHYSTDGFSKHLISFDNLKNGLLWAIKEGLEIQVLYPDYSLPEEYDNLIKSVRHIAIHSGNSDKDDVVILSGWDSLSSSEVCYEKPVVLRSTIADFFSNYTLLFSAISKFPRLNIIFVDINNFKDEYIGEYEKCLMELAERIFALYVQGNYVQFNLLTDRLMLTEMNNCNAGVDCITLSPDGNFYVCPAFYLDKSSNIGSPTRGLTIPNRQLYKLPYAPICRECDAYHCHRCVWLNQRFTYEVNTPGHEQCVMAHVERKVARELLVNLRKVYEFMPEVSIPALDYLDPFNKIVK
ncbi:MAG: CXXX repeat peptide maturase [Bacteroides sp.]|nr:CXXX repeat peptide maturase [Bacteroides sp.]